MSYFGLSEEKKAQLDKLHKDHPQSEWFNRNGAPTKENEVKLYFEKHPDASVYACARDLGISWNTAKKWK